MPFNFKNLFSKIIKFYFVLVKSLNLDFEIHSHKALILSNKNTCPYTKIIFQRL